MKSRAGVLALLRRRGVITLAGAGGAVPSLASEVAGEPVRGSWWSHPAGREIFRLAGELHDHPDVLLMKLVEGKVTFVHRDLWPAVVRLATDPARTRAARAALSAPAARLLANVEEDGATRLDRLAADRGLDGAGVRALKRAAGELEDAALVLSAQEHTESGAHATVLTAWAEWAEPGIAAAAKRLELGDARARLEEACAGLPATLLPRPPAGLQSRKSRRARPASRSAGGRPATRRKR